MSSTTSHPGHMVRCSISSGSSNLDAERPSPTPPLRASLRSGKTGSGPRRKRRGAICKGRCRCCTIPLFGPIDGEAASGSCCRDGQTGRSVSTKRCDSQCPAGTMSSSARSQASRSGIAMPSVSPTWILQKGRSANQATCGQIGCFPPVPT